MRAGRKCEGFREAHGEELGLGQFVPDVQHVGTGVLHRHLHDVLAAGRPCCKGSEWN